MFNIHDFDNGGWRADMEAALRVNEATTPLPKRKRGVYEGFRSCFSVLGRQCRQLRSIIVLHRRPRIAAFQNAPRKVIGRRTGPKFRIFNFPPKAP